MRRFSRVLTQLLALFGLMAAAPAHAAESSESLPPANVYIWVQQGFPDALAQKLARDVGERLKVKIAMIPGFQPAKGFYGSIDCPDFL